MNKEKHIQLTNIDNIIYNTLINLNNYLDADNVYEYLKNIKTKMQEFLDIFYENVLTNYILDDDINLSQFNNEIETKTINIANKILQEK